MEIEQTVKQQNDNGEINCQKVISMNCEYFAHNFENLNVICDFSKISRHDRN